MLVYKVQSHIGTFHPGRIADPVPSQVHPDSLGYKATNTCAEQQNTFYWWD